MLYDYMDCHAPLSMTEPLHPHLALLSFVLSF